jgi:hypothetical protein
LVTAQTQGHKWSKMLQYERDQRLHLEEMVEQLARQHSNLEQAAHRHRPSEFFDFSLLSVAHFIVIVKKISYNLSFK